MLAYCTMNIQRDIVIDFIVAETINFVGEMEIALKAIKDEGLIAVTNFAIPKGDLTREGIKPEDACKMMEDKGADVVGLNCYRGPKMTMKLLPKIREKVSCHVAALPVPYRTTEEYPGFLNQPKKIVDSIASTIVTSTLMSFITIPIVVFFALRYFN